MARLSSLHLQTTPGNEREVINGLLGAILDLGQQDRTSIAAHGNEYEALWRELESATRTKELRLAAEWITGAERATFLLACTGGQGDQPRRDAAAFATVAAITKHLDRPGSGLLPLLARSNVRGACDMGVLPDRLPGYDPLDDERARRCLQELWGKKLSSDRGWCAKNLLHSVSGLIVLADDPPSVLPMGQSAMDAMGRIDFLVVLDAFVTPTARIAHAVLPIANSAETEGTVTNMEGRVQRVGKAVNPPGEARDGWQVLAELCARFEVGNSYTSAKDVLNEIAQAAPQYAGIERRLSKDGWSSAFLEDSDRAEFGPHLAGATPVDALSSAGSGYFLVRDGAYDWGRDPLVLFSPTLSRDYQSERKLFPNGFVEVCQQDVDALGLGGGRCVRLTSAYGDAVVPYRVRTDLKPGVLSVPYAFRDEVLGVLGTDAVTAVNVEPA